MARDIYYRDMNRLNNEYHSLMDQAASVSLSNSVRRQSFTSEPQKSVLRVRQTAHESCRPSGWNGSGNVSRTFAALCRH